MSNAQKIIEDAFEHRAKITPKTASNELKQAIDFAIEGLDNGVLRTAEKINGEWTVNEWLKKAALLYYRVIENQLMQAEYTRYFDKFPSKFAKYSKEDFEAGGFRVVPPCVVRRGSYIARNVVLMPGFVNIGSYVDEGTMVDTYATVGSCGQIGKNVHLSGGVAIGGVLEPLQTGPVIIEDNCFIGARSMILEGVVVEENSVLGMGVYLSQSTKIYNRATREITYGRIPAGSVVVAGNLPSEDGSYSLQCAVIVKQVDAKTRAKTSINELVRGV